MYNLTYELIEGGYVIFMDGQLWIEQPFNPNAYNEQTGGYEPYTPEEAALAAEKFIADFEAGEAARIAAEADQA